MPIPAGEGAGHQSLLESALNLPLARRGKVRDVYEIPGRAELLIVASDRISAFDVVMPTPIAGKGQLLTELSTFWLKLIEAKGICKTHLVSTDAGDIPDAAFGPDTTGLTTREQLRGRIMICKRAKVVQIECVVRGYIEGSGLKEYLATGSICGVKLPPGLKQCDKLPEPIFTPATKEEVGTHDENITFERACELAGRGLMEKLREQTLAIYAMAAEHARARGIIIADTKFEFGISEGSSEPILVDEALTPDSSRFWPAADYQPGRAQKSYDKQFLREYLEGLVAMGTWNKQAPGPALPEAVVRATVDKYAEAVKILTG